MVQIKLVMILMEVMEMNSKTLAVCAGHNLPNKSCVADTAMQIELA